MARRLCHRYSLGRAGLYGASRVIAIDLNNTRLKHAKQLGADHVLNAADDDLEEQVAALSADGLGVGVAAEAVGVPATLESAARGRVLHQTATPSATTSAA